MNSKNLINHRSMNWNQFKDSVSNGLAGTVVAYWSLTREVVGSNSNDKYCVTEFFKSMKIFRENCQRDPK